MASGGGLLAPPQLYRTEKELHPRVALHPFPEPDARMCRYRVSGVYASMSLTSLPDLLTLYRSDARVTRVTDALREQTARVEDAGSNRSSQALIHQAGHEQQRGIHVFEHHHR